jgi:replicative DNA helicase
MSDLRESGSIEQDADIIMMLYREEYYDEFTEKKGVTDILMRKNRNGPIGNIELMFNKNNQKFVEIDRRNQSGEHFEDM